MRLHCGFILITLCLATAAVAQTPDKIPREIGNRANGLDYQPTPGEVGPREQQAGIKPSPAQRKATDADLERMYNKLMRDYPQDQGKPAR